MFWLHSHLCCGVVCVLVEVAELPVSGKVVLCACFELFVLSHCTCACVGDMYINVCEHLQFACVVCVYVCAHA